MPTFVYGESGPVSHTPDCSVSDRPQKSIRRMFSCRNPTACGSLDGKVNARTHSSSTV